MKPISKLLPLFVFQVAACAWPQLANCLPQAASASKTDPGDRVVLSVGGQKMTAADVEKFIQALPPNLHAFYEGQGKRLLPASIVRMKVLSAEASKEKLDQQPEVVKAMLKLVNSRILISLGARRGPPGVVLN